MIKFLSIAFYRILALMRFILRAKRIPKIRDPHISKLLRNAFSRPSDQDEFADIERLRSELLGDYTLIDRKDFGAGSLHVNMQKRSIAHIARYSLSSMNQCFFMNRLSRQAGSEMILELGTSLGISTAYLGRANPDSKIITLEGDPEIVDLALRHFKRLNLQNASLISGSFNASLPRVLQKYKSFDFLFLDGNHSYEATLDYFFRIKAQLTPSAIVILDDIHWSKGMNKAWENIQKGMKEQATFVDLFHFGIIFFQCDKCQKISLWPGWRFIFTF